MYDLETIKKLNEAAAKAELEKLNPVKRDDVTMRRLTITVPCQDNQGVSLMSLIVNAERFLLETYGAFSSYNCTGTWQDPKSLTVYNDKSVLFEIYTDLPRESLYPLAKIVKKEGNQECVLITEQPNIIFECQ